MVESPEKSKSFYLHQTDTQRGYFFDQSEVDPSFHELFGAVGRLENGGSGFIVETEQGPLFLSARHCLRDVFCCLSSCTITMPDGYSFPIYREHQLVDFKKPLTGWDRDIFISRLPHDVNPDNLPFRLRLQTENDVSQVKDGDICFSIGYPEAYIKNFGIHGPVLSAGRVYNADPTIIKHSSRIESGSSGSPLLDLNGKVIGINVKSHNGSSFPGTRYNFGVKSFAEIANSNLLELF